MPEKRYGVYLFATLLGGLALVILMAIDREPRIRLEYVTGGFEKPVGLTHAGDGSGRLFVFEKGGVIRIVQDGAVLPAPFLDLSNRVGTRAERGLLGLAFDPDYAATGYFYVNYINRVDQTIVARYQVTADDPNRANVRSEVLVLRFKQPTGNHNGGHLAFGPDGYLYIGTGDGGGSSSSVNSQDLSLLLGKLLRIDVSSAVSPGGPGYTIPDDNPFVGEIGARAEIWAYGLRNPWRFSFDRLIGDLYIADLGQDQYEEINFQPVSQPGGGNYGWDLMEGVHCLHDMPLCESKDLVLPVIEYPHTEEGFAVVGGYVYRGNAIPGLVEYYLFGDYGSGWIWATSSDRDWRTIELLDTDLVISSFGEDEQGEVYVLDLLGGGLYRLAADL